MNYYLNKRAQLNGDHEVHKAGCAYMPDLENRINLGVFPSCSEAVVVARRYFSQVNGCATCCPSCHTS